LIEERLAECQQNLRVIEKGVIAKAAASKLTLKLTGALDHLEKLSSRTGISQEQRLGYQVQIKRLRQRLLKLNVAHRGKKIFANFTSTERTILNEVFSAIYQSTEDLHKAQALVDKIVSRLSRKGASRKTAKQE
jgi:hypothetical protein